MWSSALNIGPIDWRAGTAPGYAEGSGGGWRTSAPATYTRGDRRASWVKDLSLASIQNDRGALERLHRNNREVADSPEFRALSATDGVGGDFVPPLWMVGQWIRLARAGRVIADQIGRSQLPPGTDSINLPRVASGTATAQQATQNTAIQETNATTDFVRSDVVTIAGQQTLSWQLIDQSPVSVDEVILQDMMADLATKVDTFAINNNAANKIGILNVSGANQVTFTSGTPTVSALYSKVADAIQTIHSQRFLPPTRVFMHPRRWGWLLAASDTAGRPLVVPQANAPQNVLAAMGNVSSEGYVGQLQGLPVYIDPNLPTNGGVGTNQDVIVVARVEDITLWESLPRAQAFPQPLAAQLSVLLVVSEYLAVQASRYPKAISIISGTGLTTPVF